MTIGIIGGGVYGTSIAYFLTEFSDEHVVLFEKDSIGGTSTSRSAGIVRHHYSHKRHIELAKRGREIIERLPDYAGHAGEFHRNGYLALSGADTEEEFRRTVSLEQDAGIDVELIAPDELGSIVPGIDADGIEVAALEHEAGFADPYLVTTGFAQAAAENGAEIRLDARVTDIRCRDGSVTAVTTGDDVVTVDYLVNAAGPWGGEIGRMVGVDLPLHWRESKIVVLSSDEEYGPEQPTISDTELRMYVKPEPSGDFIVGGIERPEIALETGLQGVTTEFLDRAARGLQHRLPGYADADVVNSWSGILTVSPDWYQIVGIPEGYENFFTVVGPSGHGFKEAPGFAESIAQSILGRAPQHDLAPYRLERFEEGEPLSDLEKTRKES